MRPPNIPEEEPDGHEGPPAPRASEEDVICCAIENRAREVGLACLDIPTGRLLIYNFIESSRSYPETLSLLAACQPAFLITVAQGAAGGHLGLEAATKDWPKRHCPRSSFDDSAGAALCAALANPESGPAVREAASRLRSHYLGFGAAGALVRFTEAELGLAVLPGSLEVALSDIASRMRIDPATAESLELVEGFRYPIQASQRTRGPGAPPPRPASHASLLSIMDRTRTRGGHRLLRASLLQPLIDAATLAARYDAIEELAASPPTVEALQTLLARLPRDMDRLCSVIATGGRGVTAAANATPPAPSSRAASQDAIARRIAMQVDALLLVREALSAAPGLAAALEGLEAGLLVRIREGLGHPALAALQEMASSVLDEDARPSRSAFVGRTQQCFALRSNVNGFLDTARRAFCAVTEEVHRLADEYQARGLVPWLRVSYGAKRGFYLTVPDPNAPGKGGWSGRGGRGGRGRGRGEGEEGEAAAGGGRGRGGGPSRALPPDFIMLSGPGPNRVGGRFGGGSASTLQVTTHELNALNTRLADAAHDCLILSEEMLEGVAASLRNNLPALSRLSDTLALLDLLSSLAALALEAKKAGLAYTRPCLTEEPFLAVKGGRHPLLEACAAAAKGNGGTPPVPNDIYFHSTCSLHLIMGCNMSGKSTFLRQTALLAVMAQAGSLVPAERFAFRPFDRVLTRMAGEDSIETNSSTFMVECRELAHLLAAASPRSLALLDELGRATGAEDGEAVAWAAAEKLVDVGAFTLFATHFESLAKLPMLYPSVKAFNLAVRVGPGPGPGNGGGGGPQGQAAAGHGQNRRMSFMYKLSEGVTSVPHYGLLLAETAGLPQAVVNHARRIAALIDEEEAQARDGARAAGAAGGAQHTRRGIRVDPDPASSGVPAHLPAVYSAYHTLSCLAMKARELQASAAQAAAAAAEAGQEPAPVQGEADLRRQLQALKVDVMGLPLNRRGRGAGAGRQQTE